MEKKEGEIDRSMRGYSGFGRTTARAMAAGAEARQMRTTPEPPKASSRYEPVSSPAASSASATVKPPVTIPR